MSLPDHAAYEYRNLPIQPTRSAHRGHTEISSKLPRARPQYAPDRALERQSEDTPRWFTFSSVARYSPHLAESTLTSPSLAPTHEHMRYGQVPITELERDHPWVGREFLGAKQKKKGQRPGQRSPSRS